MKPYPAVIAAAGLCRVAGTKRQVEPECLYLSSCALKQTNQ
jgi:hypothetical protein